MKTLFHEIKICFEIKILFNLTNNYSNLYRNSSIMIVLTQNYLKHKMHLDIKLKLIKDCYILTIISVPDSFLFPSWWRKLSVHEWNGNRTQLYVNGTDENKQGTEREFITYVYKIQKKLESIFLIIKIQ